MPTQFNAKHLSSNKNFQVQMTNWFEIQIGDLPDDLTFVVTTCSLPEASNTAIELPYGNSTVKMPGKREFTSGSISFMDAIGADIEGILTDWQAKVYDPATGKMGWATDFKKDVSITQYGPDGTAERPWIIEGAWPESISYTEASGESSDKKIITVSLAYDNAYRQPKSN